MEKFKAQISNVKSNTNDKAQMAGLWYLTIWICLGLGFCHLKFQTDFFDFGLSRSGI